MSSRSFEDLAPMEQLAIKQAVFSAIGEEVSTKNPDSLRSMLDATLLDTYRATGAKSYDVNVNGSKVGTYTVKVGKERTEPMFTVYDSSEFAQWLASDEGTYYAIQFAASNGDRFLKYALDEDGTVPDGVGVEMVTVPPAVSGTTLRVDSKKVAKAISNGYLPTPISRLLGGGGDA